MNTRLDFREARRASGIGLDDFAFDVRGNLYGTTDPFNTLVRVSPGGTQTVLLLTAAGRPSLLRLEVGVPGQPRP
jgi:hypothetical protein